MSGATLLHPQGDLVLPDAPGGGLRGWDLTVPEDNRF